MSMIFFFFGKELLHSRCHDSFILLCPVEEWNKDADTRPDVRLKSVGCMRTTRWFFLVQRACVKGTQLDALVPEHVTFVRSNALHKRIFVAF